MSRRVVDLLLLFSLLLSMTSPGANATCPQQTGNGSSVLDSISGSYSFLREGEFVQLTVEDGKLSGYLSRFGNSESDKGQFIDQFFDKTTFNGVRLSFNTKTVHGIRYDFTGVISTQPGKKPGEEGYHVIRGKLIEHSTDENGKETAMQREVEFKSFPAEVNR
jgi:hypothetical protein